MIAESEASRPDADDVVAWFGLAGASTAGSSAGVPDWRVLETGPSPPRCCIRWGSPRGYPLTDPSSDTQP
ncbi:MAG: hypothetical protein U5K37_06265 [Natrialbaceae archaeon]|nr:hypothetical protein [Natrialbaceae archaeon]